MGKRTGEMILGIIGGIFGIIAGLAAVVIGGIGETFGFTKASELYGLGALAIIASIIGIVGAVIVESKTRISGVLMIVAAVLGLIGVSFFYILPMILLGIAGILALLRKTEPETPMSATTIPTHPTISDKKYCAYCGSEMASDGMFCPNCGKRQS